MAMDSNSFVPYLSFEADSGYFNDGKSFVTSTAMTCAKKNRTTPAAVNEATVKVNIPEEKYQSSYLELQGMWRCA